MLRRRHPEPDPPGPGQESVWDYPRPPRLERVARRVEVRLAGELVAATDHPWRVLETSHPPTYYVPTADIVPGTVVSVPGRSFCEWKGVAAYGDVVVGAARAERVAWWYPEPTGAFADVAGAVAFYPAALECTVDGEPVVPQPGGFYGGWVTSDIAGPVKGEPGSEWW